MSHDNVITVLGATGTQGGAVAQALLTDGEFTVRAVTRNAASPRAQTLAGLGAHVVEATLTDEGSLRRAFDGAYGALVTPYWEHRSPARELAEVENLVGARRCSVRRWPTARPPPSSSVASASPGRTSWETCSSTTPSSPSPTSAAGTFRPRLPRFYAACLRRAHPAISRERGGARRAIWSRAAARTGTSR